MRILFYSTNSNTFDEKTFKISVMPSNQTTFRKFCHQHPDVEFICLSQKPGMFLPEDKDLYEASKAADDNKASKSFSENIHYLPQSSSTQDFAAFIEKQKPDLAIAMTFWISPYDWLPVSDALVSEELKQRGIKTICNSLEVGLNSFDKWRTHNLLSRLGFSLPPAVFVDHDLYFCAGSNREVLRNVYKESVLVQIKKLKLPLIIKDTTGLSSYGMTVVHTYGEAAGYLNSKRNNSNRLIQEFISGTQYGLEVYGLPGNYTVLPPFLFSVNQYGITSPKQSIKLGPCPLPDSLRLMILDLAEKLQICGSTQIDLILDDKGKWNLIEINPRLSGMSYTYATSMGTSIYELLYKACVEKSPLPKSAPYVLNLKLPLINQNQMEELFKIEGIKLLNQTNDLAAKQEREKGFCECIICGEEKALLEKAVAQLLKLFPEDSIVQQSELMLKSSCL